MDAPGSSPIELTSPPLEPESPVGLGIPLVSHTETLTPLLSKLPGLSEYDMELLELERPLSVWMEQEISGLFTFTQADTPWHRYGHSAALITSPALNRLMAIFFCGIHRLEATHLVVVTDPLLWEDAWEHALHGFFFIYFKPLMNSSLFI